MKLLFENWRKYINEDVVDLASRRQSNEKEFVFLDTAGLYKKFTLKFIINGKNC